MSTSTYSENVVVLKEANKIDEESSTDPSLSEWSSLTFDMPETNQKRMLHSKGLYSPGSGEICTKYIAISDSFILRHPYYNYPSVTDPGIIDALQDPEEQIEYSRDGQDLYMALCDEMDICPIREFHRNLINNKINLRYYGVNPIGVRAMTLALHRNKYVSILDLTDNWLTVDACYHIGQMLSNNIFMEELYLSGCRIGPKAMQCIGGSLLVNRVLRVLDISGNCIGDEGIVYLASPMAFGIAVVELNLSNNSLSNKAALALSESINFSSKLTHLDLSRNQLYQVSTTVKLLISIAQSEVLQKLNLAWNSLGEDRIANALRQVLLIPTLNSLDLSNNKFCGSSIQIISADLYKTKKLKTLNLSYNPLTPSDAYVVLEKMLKPRVKIDNLLLDDVWISKEFIWCLESVLDMNCRKNAVITYGGLIRGYTLVGPDARELIMRRADFLGKTNKKSQIDIALFFLRINRERASPIEIKELINLAKANSVPLNDDLITELGNIFPGPRIGKSKTVDLAVLADYIHRLWPDRKLPPTPPPELATQQPAAKTPTKSKKGKGKR